jgi:hypothetical protein
MSEEIPFDYQLPPLDDNWRMIPNVPKTLDLSVMADLSINGLTQTLDAEEGYRLFFITAWNQYPPVLRYEEGSKDVRAKFLGPMVWNRLLSGNSDYMDEVDRGVLDDYLSDLDGKVYGVRGTAPRIVEGFTMQYLRSGNILWKNLALNVVKGWCDSQIVTPEGYGYWEVDGAEPPFQYSNGQEPWMHDMLMLAYRVFGYQPAFEAVKRHAWYVLDRSNIFNKAAGAFNPFLDNCEGDGCYQIHFHNHSHYLVPWLKYALAETDGSKKQAMLNFILKAYSWAKSPDIGSCPEIGFFPEYVDARNSEGFNSETCCIADMIRLAIGLSLSGVGDYWDDASRWIRNHFAECQLTPEMGEKLAAWSKNWINEPSEIQPYETSENATARSIGSFAGWPMVNEWVDTIEQERGIQHCCTGNGTRAIFEIWDAILKGRDKILTVNLLLNRFSEQADVLSYLPFEGKAVVKLNRNYSTVRVRVPTWVPHASVHCFKNNAPVNLNWEDTNYVVIGGTGLHDEVRVTFQTPVPRCVTVNIHGDTFHFTMRGDTVIDIAEKGTVAPLYERLAKYSGTIAPTQSVCRYITSESTILEKTDPNLIPYGLITELEVNDEVNRDDWSVRLVLMEKDRVFGDRDYLIETLPAAYEGAEWIRPACDSKNYPSATLATFIAGGELEAYVAHDERITSKPSWLSSWTRTNDIIVDNESNPVSYRLYRKDFTEGATVTLGKNGQASGAVNYFVIVKPKVIVPAIITDLAVNDAANRADWSVQYNLRAGNLLYGDRSYLIDTLPVAYSGAEWIRTANDSKVYTGYPLATFKVIVNAEVYVAYDERVTSKPSWAGSWLRTYDLLVDNETTPVRYRFYRKDFPAGATVTLGPNGQRTGCGQYIVVVKPQSVIP